MGTWTNSNMASGISTPGGIRNGFGHNYTYGSETVHDLAVLAELDDINKAIAEQNGKTPNQSGNTQYERRLPEAFGVWVFMHPTTYSGRHRFPSDQLAFGLRKRGTTPVIQLSIRDENFVAEQMYDPADGTHPYVGAVATSAFKTTTTIDGVDFDLFPWSSIDSERNWAQRILDGDYDDWLDDFAGSIHAYKSLNTNPDNANDVLDSSNLNLKGYDVSLATSKYNNVVIRFAFEMNGGLEHSISKEDGPNGTWDRGRDEFQVAWAYVSDRIRNNPTVNGGNGVKNAYMFWCYSHEGKTSPTAANYDGSMGEAKSAWRDDLKQFVQFLGLDIYDGNGDGIDGVKNQGKRLLQYGTQFYKHYKAIWDFGDQDIPMIIGEYGTNFLHGDNPKAVNGVTKLNWGCDKDTGSVSRNERCRGRWIDESFDEIKTKRDGTAADHQKYKALKGHMYFAIDHEYNKCWGLWSGTLDDYDPNTAGEQTPNPEPRPTLAEAAGGDWSNTSESGAKYSFYRWARLQDPEDYDGTYRGYGGALFAENVPSNT